MSQAIPPDNPNDGYHHAVAGARAALERAVAARVSADASVAECERAILMATNEACRLALAAQLRAMAAAHADHVRVDGVLYQRHHDATAAYHTAPISVRSVWSMRRARPW